MDTFNQPKKSAFTLKHTDIVTPTCSTFTNTEKLTSVHYKCIHIKAELQNLFKIKKRVQLSDFGDAA